MIAVLFLTKYFSTTMHHKQTNALSSKTGKIFLYVGHKINKLDKNCVEFERRCRLRKNACYTFSNGSIFYSIFMNIE